MLLNYNSLAEFQNDFTLLLDLCMDKKETLTYDEFLEITEKVASDIFLSVLPN
jgi:hypothetical protein